MLMERLNKIRPWFRRWGGPIPWPVWIVGILGIAASVTLSLTLVSYQDREVKARFMLDASQRIRLIEQEFADNTNLLRYFGAFFKASKEVTRQEFDEFYAQSYHRNNIGAAFHQAIGWIMPVPGEERLDHEAKYRAAGYENYQVFDRDAEKNKIRSKARQMHYPVVFLQPEVNGVLHRGFDMASAPTRYISLKKAAESGELTVTERFLMVIDEKIAVLAAVAVYEDTPGEPEAAPESRKVKGFAYAVIRIDRVVEKALHNLTPMDIDISILDVTDAGQPKTLFGFDQTATGQADASGAGPAGVGEQPEVQLGGLRAGMDIHVGGRTWKLEARPGPGYMRNKTSFLPLGFLGAGLGGTAILVIFLLGLEQRRGVEAALHESEEKFSNIFRSTKVGTAIEDLDGRFIQVNPAFCDLLGYREEEILGKSFRDVTSGDSMEASMDAIGRLLSGADAHIDMEKAYVRKDGSSFWGSANITLANLDDEHQVLIVHLTDVSDRKHMEEALRESEQLFRTAFQSAAIGINMTGPDGRFMRVNQAFCDMVGYAEEELLEMSLYDITDPADLDRSHEVREGSASGKLGGFEIEKCLLHKNGHKVEVRVHSSQLHDAQGRLVGNLAQIQNITRRKLIENALRESERRFKELAEVSPVGVFHTDPEGNVLYVNGTWCEMAGMTAQQAVSDGWAETMHPDDRDRIFAEWADFVKTSEPHVWEYRFLRPDGTIRWVMVQAVAQIEEAGNVMGYVGAVTDITERKTGEEDVLRAASVFQATSDAVMIVDAEEKIVAVNPAFQETTGYQSEDVLGRNPSILGSGRHDVAFFKSMWQSLKETGKWEGEIWNRRKNGEAYLAWQSIIEIRDSSGNASQYVAVFEDITKRKETEEIMHYRATHDALTDLVNRDMFLERLRAEIARARRLEKGLSILFIDLDGFKEVNDTLGHQAGDALLIQVAQRFLGSVRAMDTVARLGGDEFTILISDIAEPTDIGRIADKIRSSLSAPFQLSGQETSITCSIGISFFPVNGSTPMQLVNSADAAMYKAKDAGKNTFVLA